MNLPSSVNFVFLPLLSLNQHLSSTTSVCNYFFSSLFLRVCSTLFVSLVLLPIFFSLSKPFSSVSPPLPSFLSLPAPQLTYWFHFHTVGSCSLRHKPSALPPFKPALITVEPITTNHHRASLSARALCLLLLSVLFFCALCGLHFLI